MEVENSSQQFISPDNDSGHEESNCAAAAEEQSLNTSNNTTAQIASSLNTSAAAAAKWTAHQDSLLLTGAKLALKNSHIPRGNYSKCLEYIDNVPEEEFEPFCSDRGIKDSRSRLGVLIHKVPKYRTLNEMLSLADGYLCKQQCHNNAQLKANNSIIDQAIKLSSSIMGARDSYVARKIQKCKIDSSVDVSHLKKRFISQWALLSNDQLRRKIARYAKSSGNETSKPREVLFPLKQMEVSIPQPFQPTESLVDENASLSSMKSFMTDSLPLPSQNTSGNVPKKPKKEKYVPFENEPKPPPSNAYALFTRSIVKTFPKNLSSKERLTRVSQEWKVASEKVKDELKQELAVMKQKYMVELAAFLRTLSKEEDLIKFAARHKGKMSDLHSINGTAQPFK